MYFNSLNFLIFITVSALVYFHIPLKGRKTWLLIISLFFYASFGWKYTFFIVGLVLATYLLGLLMEKGRYKKLLVFAGVLSSIGMLLVLKYSDFLLSLVSQIMRREAFDLLSFIVPVGLSFYTLQALGYLMDIYYGKIKAERNIISYALFICFFPQICSGPIGRAGELIPQINNLTHTNPQVFKSGLFHIAYGLFLKIVVADRIAAIIDPIINNYNDYLGMQLVLSIMLFGIEIYCDFNGYTTMACGCAEVFGISLRKNFKQPYLSVSVKEFWRKWHISLTSWFTDYLYIPLGGNRKGTIRKYINIMLVFLVSGLWHGAGRNFIIWGGLNGLFLVLEGILLPIINSVNDKYLHIDYKRKAFCLFRMAAVFLAIDFAWLFFRVSALKDIMNIIIKAIKEFRLSWFFSENMFLTFGSAASLGILFVSIVAVILADYYENKYKEEIFDLISRQTLVVRWSFYFLMLFIILTWGMYGMDYAQTQFIYFKF